MKCYLIDACRRDVSEIDIADYGCLTEMVGGALSTAWMWPPNGDVLYVSDDGLLAPGQQHYFWLDEVETQPLAGNGILLGPDSLTSDTSLPPIHTLQQIRAKIRFVSRVEVAAWARLYPAALRMDFRDSHGRVYSTNLTPSAFPEIF